MYKPRFTIMLRKVSFCTFKFLSNIHFRGISSISNKNRNAGNPAPKLFVIYRRNSWYSSGIFADLTDRLLRRIIKYGDLDLTFNPQKFQKMANMMSQPQVKSKAILESCSSATNASTKVIPDGFRFQREFLKYSPKFDKNFSLNITALANLYVLGTGAGGGIYIIYKVWTGFLILKKVQLYSKEADIAFNALLKFYEEHDPSSIFFDLDNFLELENFLLDDYFREIEKLKSLSVMHTLIMGFEDNAKHNLLIDQYLTNHQNILDTVNLSSINKKGEVLEKLSNFKPVIMRGIKDETILIPKTDTVGITDRGPLSEAAHFYLEL